MIKCGITGFNGNLGKTFLKINSNLRFIKFKGDIRKKVQVEKWIKSNDFDLLVHFAALVPISVVNKKYKDAINVNYFGTKYLVDSIIKYNKKISWFFFSSTSHVYPHKNFKIKEKLKVKPSSKYGKTKLLAENYIIRKLSRANIEFCIGRIFSILDNKNKDFFLASLLKKINNKKKLIYLTNYNHRRDFLTTDQISRIIFHLWRKKKFGIINIGSGIKTDLRDLAIFLAKKKNKKVSFGYNKPTCLVADISKLKKTGFKVRKLNLKSFTNYI